VRTGQWNSPLTPTSQLTASLPPRDKVEADLTHAGRTARNVYLHPHACRTGRGQEVRDLALADLGAQEPIVMACGVLTGNDRAQASAPSAAGSRLGETAKVVEMAGANAADLEPSALGGVGGRHTDQQLDFPPERLTEARERPSLTDAGPALAVQSPGLGGPFEMVGGCERSSRDP
jgi:hypothetical protein